MGRRRCGCGREKRDGRERGGWMRLRYSDFREDFNVEHKSEGMEGRR